MNGSWLFPESNTMHRTGLSEAGIETFNGSPVSSLVREVCQNSLDAAKDKTLPVVVEFRSFDISTNKFPDGERLLKIFKLCEKFSCTNMDNKRTSNFFHNNIELFNNEKLRMLRISDYNTMGLSGSDEIDKINPWTGLIYSDGISDKDKDSAGSFGIGKNAPFACSEFRTVFYSTLDYTGKSASQGVSKLISFKNENENFVESIGYFGNNQYPIFELLNLDPGFNRTSSGTDIYISAFKCDIDFEKQIICSVLENFILSIYSKTLDVIVNDKKINKDSLSHIMKKYSTDLKYANDYYKVLVSDKCVSTQIGIGDIGNINLRILFNKDFKRRILMSRSNGMKIYDQDHMPSSIYFAGIVTTADEKTNQFFRDMENPQHNGLEPDRCKKNALKYKKILHQMRHDIKQFIIEKGQGTVTDQVDAEGVGEFLPDLSQDQTDVENKVNSEGLNYRTGNVLIKRTQIKNDSNGQVEDGSSDDIIDSISNLHGNYNENGVIKGYSHGIGHREGKYSPIASRNENLEGDSTLFRNKIILPLSIRMMSINPTLNMYKLIFLLKNVLNHGYIEINLSCEQGNDKAKIGEAFMIGKESHKKLKVRSNKIYLENMPKMEKIGIEFKLSFSIANFPINCSLEAKIYGYKK
ncbi:hypothetical protein [Clostridium autoethanogenum]|uniref:Uncharacterized protein n=1 Tax=Clostridium autoethanogenum DSM 10061 TaxID=1341692 RepID=A0ABN4BD70_9CLOT|nr:hypothetical protein [Clostridium autoethanogenum]AGY75244.1 hypothetical protein CAETHG_1019 [Clostridium autoethanogenum DSM 10061]ALU35413.1 Hypothetical protein CLAU_0984 [Clostridium autoethanogenum DSM 10061]OVY49508.1 hypothetical protein WX72_03433 [Clostridium autoethanogenum]DAD54139.1 TPA_exp: protein of unknown function KV_029 [Clostridium autoethanogenum DSM 10061]